MQGERPKRAARAGPAEVARIPVLPSATMRFYLRKVRRSFMCKVKIVQVHRCPVSMLVRFLCAVSSSGKNPSE